MTETELLERIRRCGVVAVLTVERAEQAVPLARALLAGGLDAMELTLRTPAAVEALRAVVNEVPEMLAGAGTVLTPDQVAAVQKAGAAFAVAPGLNAKVVKAARKVGLYFAPGVATPSDIELAVELGCRTLKIFPAEPLGGPAYLKSISAPYAHLGLRFIPLGGLTAANVKAYFKDPQVVAVGGSWIATKETISKGDWPAITQLAREAVTLAKEARAGEGPRP